MVLSASSLRAAGDLEQAWREEDEDRCEPSVSICTWCGGPILIARGRCRRCGKFVAGAEVFRVDDRVSIVGPQGGLEVVVVRTVVDGEMLLSDGTVWTLDGSTRLYPDTCSSTVRHSTEADHRLVMARDIAGTLARVRWRDLALGQLVRILDIVEEA